MSDESELKEFATRLSAMLEGKRISASELARRLGVSPSTVSEWLRGSNYPRMKVQPKLTEILETSTGYLLHGTPTSSEPDSQFDVKTTREQTKGDRLPRASDPSRRMFVQPSYSKDSPTPEISRAELMHHVKLYLDEAERTGGMSHAAIKIWRELDIADFKILEKGGKP